MSDKVTRTVKVPKVEWVSETEFVSHGYYLEDVTVEAELPGWDVVGTSQGPMLIKKDLEGAA